MRRESAPTARLTQGTPRPFIRWVGGKRWAIPLLLPLLPRQFGAYHEPFLGGGALFFAIAATRAGDGRAYLSDLNPDLIDAWTTVRDDHEAVIRALEVLHAAHTLESYRRVFRAGPPATQAEHAAWFIYLTNGGYDGAWRRTRAGLPTISPSRKPLAMPDQVNLSACATTLAGARLAIHDFREIAAEPGDLVIFDPPYLDPAQCETHPYYASTWTTQDQQDLIELAQKLQQDGVHVVLCQPDRSQHADDLANWLAVTGSPNRVRRERFMFSGSVAIKR